MTELAQDAAHAGRAAVERHAWREGYELLSEADSAGVLGGEELERLAEAAWWMGRLGTCIDARERAHALYVDAGESRSAARVALDLTKDYFAKQQGSVATGWLSRAERLLADEPESPERAYLERLKGVIAFEGRGDFDTALEHARRLSEIAERLGNRDLLALGLHDQGRALIALGQVGPGMALMDEATVAAVSGELMPMTTGVLYCNMITACEELADYRRAGDWTEAAKRWCERTAIAGFPGLCRVHRASILRVRGAWPEAEQEVRRACAELREFNVGYTAAGFYELGEIRLRLGDLAGAEEAFREAHELGHDPQPGLALLRLAEGKVDAASACIDEALAEETRDLHRARLLPVQAEIAVHAGDAEKARRAAAELEAVGERYDSEFVTATAAAARARAELAEGNATAAGADARRALRLWQGVDAPYESAHARVLLADAHAASGNPDDAALELQAALAVFERLGATPGARSVRERLDALGVQAPGRAGGQATRTFMFTDIERSTKLVDALGDDAWTDLVRWHDQTFRSLFATHGGEEIDHAGDGFFVAFPDADAALECGVAVQRTLADHRRAHGFAPQVRIGIHTAEATRQAGGYKGKGVHEAARISALAAGGEVVASLATAAGGRRFALSEPRRVDLKGFDEPFEVVSVEWR
ncbi:MAG: adenylate/guanylate cyclase domain-containing protein [Gaiellales bacterium]